MRVLIAALMLTLAGCTDDPVSPGGSPPPPAPVPQKLTHGTAIVRAFGHAHLVQPIHGTSKDEPSPQCRLQPYRPDDRMKSWLTAIQMPELGDDAALRETWKALTRASLRNDDGKLISDFGHGPDYYDLGDGSGTLTLRTGLVCLAKIDGEEREVDEDYCRSNLWQQLNLPRPRLAYTRETVIQSARVVTDSARIVRDTIPGDMVIAMGDGNLHVLQGELFGSMADQSLWCSGGMRK